MSLSLIAIWFKFILSPAHNISQFMHLFVANGRPEFAFFEFLASDARSPSNLLLFPPERVFFLSSDNFEERTLYNNIFVHDGFKILFGGCTSCVVWSVTCSRDHFAHEKLMNGLSILCGALI